jgi:hypothetical protein
VGSMGSLCAKVHSLTIVARVRRVVRQETLWTQLIVTTWLSVGIRLFWLIRHRIPCLRRSREPTLHDGTRRQVVSRSLGGWALSGGGPDLVCAVSEVRPIIDRTGFARGLIPFVVIGASGDVSPVALLVVEARRRRIRTLLLHLNPGKTPKVSMGQSAEKAMLSFLNGSIDPCPELRHDALRGMVSASQCGRNGGSKASYRRPNSLEPLRHQCSQKGLRFVSPLRYRCRRTF